MPRAKDSNVEAIVIAGEAMGEKTNVFTNVPITYGHFTLTGPATHFHPLAVHHNDFVYVIESGRRRVCGGPLGGPESIKLQCSTNGARERPRWKQQPVEILKVLHKMSLADVSTNHTIVG
ncbi:hypothetical protein H310_12176 [Aphanomyces invadans]|uniref:Uncharacterized protein n=1 Tax=Aphanomyces invadans TaxID=157072 RepID=A0A024TKN4_9STRA|nr:hypothetical protein H310_12176 [Aphanomyces invadans]ETV94176.1 hypothetical protein H310_12176 [Aphanomyces invadans]|eukprot:XP_008877379.1 hypothetical protein H310_12176 [Aphanomyces invadans]